jgi:hypothetical protein
MECVVCAVEDLPPPSRTHSSNRRYVIQTIQPYLYNKDRVHRISLVTEHDSADIADIVGIIVLFFIFFFNVFQCCVGDVVPCCDLEDSDGSTETTATTCV